MNQLPAETVGEAYTSDFGWSVLADLVADGHRMAGQTAEKAGAGIVADAFEEAGLRDVRTDRFPLPGWWRGSSSLWVDGRTYEHPHELIALPGTPAGSLEGPLVDGGFGTDAELVSLPDEAIVLVSSRAPPDRQLWHHRMEKYAAALEAGASGFIYHNHVPGCLPATGEVGYHARPASIPAVGVSKEVGDRLVRAVETRAPTARLEIDCEHRKSTSQNVEAEVGPATEEAVLLTAHIDSHDISEGAADNAVGCAVIAEVGRLLASLDDYLETTVRLVAFGAEEVGLYGAYHWAERHDLGTVKAVLNVDGIRPSRTLHIDSQGFEAITDAVSAVTDSLEVPLSTDDAVSPHADQWPFVERGVPAAMISTTSEEEGRGWGHTHADTLDKLDIRDLRTVSALLAGVVVEVAREDRSFSRRDPSEIEAALSEGYVRELKVGGRWPFGEA